MVKGVTVDVNSAKYNMYDTNTTYYNEMAIAWLLSELLVKYYEKTVNYLKTSKLDKFTFNKGIQKACESFRITKEQKEYLRKLKR